MPVGFQRAFRLTELLFPRSSPDTRSFPDRVNEDVQPVWDVFRLTPGEVKFRHQRIAQVAIAGSNTIQLLEPTAGRIFRNVGCSCFTDKATNTNLDTQVNVTTQAPDRWGAWAVQLALVGNALLLQNIATQVTLLPLLTRGNAHEIVFKGMAGGENMVINWFFYDYPGEIADLSIPF